MSLTGGGAAYRDGQGRTRCRRCDKIVYAGEEEAQAAADAARAERVLLRAYREPACGYWHLTSRAELPLQAQQEERARERERSERGRGYQPILVALVVVVVVAAAVSAFLLDRLGGDEPDPTPPVAATPAAATSVPTPTATPAATATADPARTATPSPSPTATPPPPTPAPTPAPIVVWTIGNTDATGVALRDDCDDEARYSARGEGWADDTRVELIEEGGGRCEGWLNVQADDEVSWVRREYLTRRVLASTWTVGNTGGAGVARRGDCLDSARISEPGEGWVDDTEVRLLEVGEGRCAGWLRVESAGLESWVRERYLVEVVE